MTAPLLEARDLRTHFPIRRGLFGRAAQTLRAAGFPLINTVLLPPLMVAWLVGSC